jgi:hypothetical protein
MEDFMIIDPRSGITAERRTFFDFRRSAETPLRNMAHIHEKIDPTVAIFVVHDIRWCSTVDLDKLSRQ